MSQQTTSAGSWSRALRITALAGLSLSLVPASSASEPQALSPGSPGTPAAIDRRCPTFSWSEVPDAIGYELEIAPTAHGFESDAAWRIALPAGTLSWTAAGPACLVPAVSRSWRVRALLDGTSEEWSDARELHLEPDSPPLATARRLLAEIASERLAPDELEQLAQLGWQPARTRPRIATASPSAAGRQEPLATVTGAMVTPPSSGTLYIKDGHQVAVWAKGTGFGVWGETAAAHGEGIRGEIDLGEVGTSTVAIEGISEAVDGVGVFGWATNDPGNDTVIPTGVRGTTWNGIGVHGLVTAPQGTTIGVYGQSSSPSGRGVCANAAIPTVTDPTPPDTYYGAWGESSSSSGYDFYAGGNGMNYGSFTGSHEVRLDPTSPAPSPGMVMSLTGRAETRWATDGSVDLSSTMPSVTLSRKPADPAVVGVYVKRFELPDGHWLEDRSGHFAVINALGEGRVWVTDRNGPIEAGDFLTTSEVPGHAQRQDEPELRSHTVGRAIESVDWDAVTQTISHRGRTYRAALIAVVYTSG